MSTGVDADSAQGAVEPSQRCPHIFSGSFCLENQQVYSWLDDMFNQGEDHSSFKPCADCGTTCAETWVCLKCGRTGCSRFQEGHMEGHWLGSLGSGEEHCLALSLSDLSIWCYCCNNYVKHDALVPALVRAEKVKFAMEEENLARLGRAISRFNTAIALPSSSSDLHQHPTASHPERPLRTQIASQMLEYTTQLSELRTISYSAATREDLLLTHKPEYIDKIFDSAQQTPEGKEARDVFNASADLYVTEHSAQAILESAGAAAEMTKKILSGEVSRGFCLTRPPGHHAEKGTAGGFCYLNNTAIAANIAINNFGIDRVLIVDWDIHHGNGNQDIFYDSNKVLHISIHKQIMHYKGELVECSSDGKLEMIGKDTGLGYNINVALGEGDVAEGGIGLGDGDFKEIFSRIVLPIAKEFKPQFIILPAGFDAGISDRNLITGGYSVTPACYAELTSMLLNEVPSAEGKMLVCLEGGYEPHGVAVAISSVITALVQFDNPQCRFRASSPPSHATPFAASASSISTHTPISTGDGVGDRDGVNTTSSSSSSGLAAGGGEGWGGSRHNQNSVHADTDAALTKLEEILRPYWKFLQEEQQKS